MKHQATAALYSYWLACHTDVAVRAGGIDAAELAPLVPDLFLLEFDPAGDAKFRFCGAELAVRYARDLAGERFLALWSAPDRTELEQNLQLMRSRSTGMVMGVMGETMGSGFVSYEVLLLPLVGERGGAGALGSMVRVGGHDEQNRIRCRIVAQSLRSTRFLPVEGRPPSTMPAPVPQRPKRYGHLTVLSGGR
jgi:hypothetical protein